MDTTDAVVVALAVLAGIGLLAVRSARTAPGEMLLGIGSLILLVIVITILGLAAMA